MMTIEDAVKRPGASPHDGLLSADRQPLFSPIAKARILNAITELDDRPDPAARCTGYAGTTPATAAGRIAQKEGL